MDSEYWEYHYRYEGIPHIYDELSPDDPMLNKGDLELSGRMIVQDYGPTWISQRSTWATGQIHSRPCTRLLTFLTAP